MTEFARKVKPKILQPDDQRSNKIIIKEWFIRWDKTIAVVTAIVIIFTLLVLVIFRLNLNGPNEERLRVVVKNFDSSRIFKNILSTAEENLASHSCTHASNYIECKDVDVGQLCENINGLVDGGKSEVDELRLIDVTYENDTINNGWLSCVTQRFAKLTISGHTLLHLGDGAFSGFPFETGIEFLTISNTKITTYSKGSFTGARIDTLQIYDGDGITLEENVFAEIATSLKVLLIQRVIYTPQSLINATGSKATPLYKLDELDLQFNILDILTNDSFKSVSKVTRLYLSNSNIQAIEAGTFKDLRLEILDLRCNRLFTIPEHVFDTVLTGIYITGNVWLCDCKLLWFRDYYNTSIENGKNQFKDEFLCNNEIIYTEVDFCPNGSTTVLPPPTSESTERTTSASTTVQTTTHDDSPTGTTTVPTDTTATTGVTSVPTEATSLAPTAAPTTAPPTTTDPTTVSTTTASTTSTIPPNEDNVNVSCFENNYYDSTDPEAFDSSFQAWLRKGTVGITICSKGTEHIVYINGAENDDLLIWFNVQKKEEIYCSYNLQSPKHLLSLGQSHLPANETYTLCLMRNGTHTVSAFDCMGYTTPLQWDDQAWIPHRSMNIVIGAICGSLLAAVLISGLIVFYCIRQHPSLIKGNKRVIMVESQAADAIVMPKYYDQINYIPPSFVSSSQGYLTPVIRARRRSGGVRTISRNSSMMEVPPPRIGRYRRRSRVRLEQVPQNFDEHLYESPPPLPPNHPSEWIYNSSINSFSRV